MAHLRSASQAGELGERALRVFYASLLRGEWRMCVVASEEDEGGGASKKQRTKAQKIDPTQTQTQTQSQPGWGTGGACVTRRRGG